MKKSNSTDVMELPATKSKKAEPFRRQTKPTSQRSEVQSGTQNGAKHAPQNEKEEESSNGTDSTQKQILKALIGLKKGNFSVRLPVEWTDTEGKLADTFNDLAELMEHSTADLSRVSRVVGR